MRRGDGDNTSARHDKPPGSDQKRATSRISPASHRGRKIVARCAGGDPLWQGIAQGRVRYERFWALLATVGGEAAGVGERRFGDHTGPRIEDKRCWSAKRQHALSEIQFSIACIVRKLASTATRTRCCGLDAAEIMPLHRGSAKALTPQP